MTEIPHKNNFDLLRLFLALSVLLSHLEEVTGFSGFFALSNCFNSAIAVDCFFVVSGFLIFRSFERSSSTLSYLNKRVRRIYPAYVTVVIAAAFLLPFFFSSGTTKLLFSSEWFRYLGTNLAFLNFLQPELPGIFSSNPLQVINPPLWTIKVEVMFYLSVPFIFLLVKNRKKWLVLCSLYAASVVYSTFFLQLHAAKGMDIYLRFEKQLPGQLTFFLSGGGLYLYFAVFQKYWKQCLLAAISLLIVSSQNLVAAQLSYPVSLAIVVIFAALIFPYLGNWGKFGDISYGVYIYHFPILQIFTHLSLFDQQPWLAFGGLMTAVLTTAFLSYHCIESPFLRRSSHYRQAVENKESS